MESTWCALLAVVVPVGWLTRQLLVERRALLAAVDQAPVEVVQGFDDVVWMRREGFGSLPVVWWLVLAANTTAYVTPLLFGLMLLLRDFPGFVFGLASLTVVWWAFIVHWCHAATLGSPTAHVLRIGRSGVGSSKSGVAFVVEPDEMAKLAEGISPRPFVEPELWPIHGMGRATVRWRYVDGPEGWFGPVATEEAEAIYGLLRRAATTASASERHEAEAALRRVAEAAGDA